MENHVLVNPNEITEFLDKPNGVRLTRLQLREHLLAGLNTPIVGAFDDGFIESLRLRHKLHDKENTD